MTSGALVLATLDAIGAMIWYSMLRVLPAEGGADGRCAQSVGGASEIAVPRARAMTVVRAGIRRPVICANGIGSGCVALEGELEWRVGSL